MVNKMTTFRLRSQNKTNNVCYDWDEGRIEEKFGIRRRITVRRKRKIVRF